MGIKLENGQFKNSIYDTDQHEDFVSNAGFHLLLNALSQHNWAGVQDQQFKKWVSRAATIEKLMWDVVEEKDGTMPFGEQLNYRLATQAVHQKPLTRDGANKMWAWLLSLPQHQDGDFATVERNEAGKIVDVK